SSWQGRLTGRVVVAGLVVLLAIPLVIALAALRQPRWYPLMDMAQTELRVRDVASDHPPLIGAKGRFFTGETRQASHPDPVSFWALWPTYRLLGATSWALQRRRSWFTSWPWASPSSSPTVEGGVALRSAWRRRWPC
ncbi:MAG: hypothetical protein M3R01_15455, partial [Actinomycetota bacterium]|nr:hypothetical protein [Actinomycetota bacterium]